MQSDKQFPTLFVSHGAPDIVLKRDANSQSLRELSAQVPTPRAIVVVSAHWSDSPIGVTSAAKPETIHDFGGFAPELYDLQYPAPGDVELSHKIAGLIKKQNIASKLHPARGFDHGVWIPLMLMYPEATIPVIQVSLPASNFEQLVTLGEALAPLRDDGILIIGSGGSVHNLRKLDHSGKTEPWVEEFEEWLRDSIEGNKFENLIKDEILPGTFRDAHPTIEHFVPLIVAWAAGGRKQPGKRVYQGYSYGNLGISHYLFGTAQ